MRGPEPIITVFSVDMEILLDNHVCGTFNVVIFCDVSIRLGMIRKNRDCSHMPWSSHDSEWKACNIESISDRIHIMNEHWTCMDLSISSRQARCLTLLFKQRLNVWVVAFFKGLLCLDGLPEEDLDQFWNFLTFLVAEKVPNIVYRGKGNRTSHVFISWRAVPVQSNTQNVCPGWCLIQRQLEPAETRFAPALVIHGGKQHSGKHQVILTSSFQSNVLHHVPQISVIIYTAGINMRMLYKRQLSFACIYYRNILFMNHFFVKFVISSQQMIIIFFR